MAFSLLASEGAVASVGLIGNRIDIPLFPLLAREYTYFGLGPGRGRTDTLDAIGRGDVIGRAVIVYD